MGCPLGPKVQKRTLFGLIQWEAEAPHQWVPAYAINYENSAGYPINRYDLYLECSVCGVQTVEPYVDDEVLVRWGVDIKKYRNVLESKYVAMG